MDVPAAVLEELKCSRCEGYLSRSPVYLQHDGAAACGRCFAPERPATRNKLYEATARLLKFPCKYRELGCRETVPYVGQEEEIAHEATCQHRQYVCPLLGSARCDWLGSTTEILQHCQTKHPDKVVDNPATLVHDISKASGQTYLLRAYQMMFLLYTKVCLVSGRIFHSVRFLGAADEAANFSFTLDIKRGDELVSKKGQVAPQGCLAIQEPTLLALNTNSLLDVLGGFDGATFTVTVKRRVSDAADQLARAAEKCAGCAAEVTVFRYRGEGGWRCECCAPARRACVNQPQGCTYTDIDNKYRKHEDYFCQQRTQCIICAASVLRGSLSAHYGSVHQHMTHGASSTWRATGAWLQHSLVSSVAGTAVCSYWLKPSLFVLLAYIPVSSERLREFCCEVRVTDPATGHARTFTPPTEYDKWYDWHIQVTKEEFPSCNTGLDVCVDIRKAD